MKKDLFSSEEEDKNKDNKNEEISLFWIIRMKKYLYLFTTV